MGGAAPLLHVRETGLQMFVPLLPRPPTKQALRPAVRLSTMTKHASWCASVGALALTSIHWPFAGALGTGDLHVFDQIHMIDRDNPICCKQAARWRKESDNHHPRNST
jgi:hypothetical protein